MCFLYLSGMVSGTNVHEHIHIVGFQFEVLGVSQSGFVNNILITRRVHTSRHVQV